MLLKTKTINSGRGSVRKGHSGSQKKSSKVTRISHTFAALRAILHEKEARRKTLVKALGVVR